MADEHIDFGDDEYGGSQKMQYPGGGTIPALADEEPIGEDDEYDELYNDVNVGDSFMQMHRPEPPTQPVAAQKNDGPDPRFDTGSSRDPNMPGAPGLAKYSGPGASFPGQNEGQPAINRPDIGSYPPGSSVSQKGGSMEITRDNQVKNMGFQGMASTPSKIGVSPDMSQKYANEAAQSFNSGPQGALQVPANQMGINFNQSMVNENQIRPPVENGPTMLFVGELHWWTTDAELESACSQFGRIKEIKFFDERASGKSKGYCQVEFYDPAAAAACKEGLNGHLFNGRACVVAFASPQTLKQMGANYMNRTEGGQSQTQTQGRRPNDGMGRGGNGNNQSGEAGRNYGRGAWGRGGQGPGPGGPGRGRGTMGAKNMGGVGNGAGGMGGYGRGPGPAFGGPPGGMMHPQGMMGAGFDPTYMGRGGGYGGFPGPGFPGMLPPFPGVNAMGLGVAPHINPAFFGRGMAPNGMGMMGSSGMDGPHAGMWGDSSMGGWGGDEQDRRTRESSYGGEDGGSEYGYGEANHEKGRSSAASREKERPSEREWSENTDRKHRSERDRDWDRSEREHKEHKYREEKDGYREHRQRERDADYEDDWDRGQSSSRSRSRSRAMVEEKHRSRSRDADYGKRRRGPSE